MFSSDTRGIEAIVFDAVGTLIKPRPPVPAAYASAAARQGVVAEAEVISRRFRRRFRLDEEEARSGPMTTDEGVEHRRWRRIVSDVLPGLPDPDRAFSELWGHFGRAEAWTCFDDVAPALESLRESGIRVVVGSNFDGRLRSVLRGLPELAELADSAVISSEVGHRKPHPSFYRAVCDRLGIPPERILSVGDDLHNDVVGARRSGLRGALIDRSGSGIGDAAALSSLLGLAETLGG